MPLFCIYKSVLQDVFMLTNPLMWTNSMLDIAEYAPIFRVHQWQAQLCYLKIWRHRNKFSFIDSARILAPLTAQWSLLNWSRPLVWMGWSSTDPSCPRWRELCVWRDITSSCPLARTTQRSSGCSMPTLTRSRKGTAVVLSSYIN